MLRTSAFSVFGELRDCLVAPADGRLRERQAVLMDESWPDASECLVLSVAVGSGLNSSDAVSHHDERGAAFAEEVEHGVATELVGEHELHEALVARPGWSGRRAKPLMQGSPAVLGQLPGRRGATGGRRARCDETELVEVPELRVELP